MRRHGLLRPPRNLADEFDRLILPAYQTVFRRTFRVAAGLRNDHIVSWSQLWDLRCVRLFQRFGRCDKERDKISRSGRSSKLCREVADLYTAFTIPCDILDALLPADPSDVAFARRTLHFHGLREFPSQTSL